MATKLHSCARVAPAGDTARQFVIERHCSGCKDRGARALPVPFPIVVWTVGESWYQPPDSCGGHKYTVDYPEAVAIRSRLGVNTPNEQVVCTCSGHFIE